jgi:hypothetical protein
MPVSLRPAILTAQAFFSLAVSGIENPVPGARAAIRGDLMGQAKHLVLA